MNVLPVMSRVSRYSGHRGSASILRPCRIAMLALVMSIFLGLSCAAGTYDVRSYGARGDGATNDSAAIQRAIDAASATSGMVTFPAGTFRVDGTLYLKSGVTLSGIAGETVLHMPAKPSSTSPCTAWVSTTSPSRISP